MKMAHFFVAKTMLYSIVFTESWEIFDEQEQEAKVGTC
jgi:hypothetical protein